MAAMPTPERATLSDAARTLLEQPAFATIATIDPDGAPRQAVVWYRLDPDERILLNSRTPRLWCTNLQRDGRVAISVVDPANGYRWLGLTGVVDEVVEDLERAREDIVALAFRYHPEGTEESVASFRTQPRVTFLVRITGIHDHLES